MYSWIFAGLLLGFALYYSGLLAAFTYGWHRVASGARRPHEEPLVSIIVPARDEADSISGCLESIFANDYPEGRYEVIVVDDLSRDETPARVKALQARYNYAAALAGPEDEEETENRLRFFRMPENLERTRAHKKRAIEKGISEANGDIILTTDADCTVPGAWIRHMVSAFDNQTAFVSGPVLYKTDGRLWTQSQALEFLGLVAVGAGAIGIARPNMCNGANVAYRADVFRRLGGFNGIDHLTSGDDELLMQKIAYNTSWQVRFCTEPGAAVSTLAVSSPSDFFAQRKRWASKGARYRNRNLVAMIAGIYLFYVMLLVSPIVALFWTGQWLVVGLAFAAKICSESALLVPAARHFSRQRLLKLFIPLQMFQIVYVVVVGAAGSIGGYTWKGRAIDQ